MEDKKNFVDALNKFQEDQLNQHHKKCTPEEYEEIGRGIIERLYEKGHEKVAQRNDVIAIDEKNKFDFEKRLRSDYDRYNRQEHADKNRKRSSQSRTKGARSHAGMKKPLNLSPTYQNYQDKIISVENYTFGKKSNQGNFYRFDQNMQLDLEQEHQGNREQEVVQDNRIRTHGESDQRKKITVEPLEKGYLNGVMNSKNRTQNRSSINFDENSHNMLSRDGEANVYEM